MAAARRPLFVSLTLCVAVAAAACVGQIGDAGSGNAGASAGSGASGRQDGGLAPGLSGADGPTRFSCDPTQKSAIDGLRALTTAQYTNTVTDLVSWALGDPSAGASILGEAMGTSALPGNVPIVPSNNVTFAATFPDGGWLRADQDQQITRVRAFYTIGIALGQALSTPARLTKLAGACATDRDASNDAACLSAFIQRFGSRALRRALNPSDTAFLTSVYGSDPTADPAAYADVVSVILNMPDVLYFVEHGDVPVTNTTGVYTMSATELASRLSYQVWDTMPDDELWSKAIDGTLLDDVVYRHEVDRLFADPRARAAMHRFFEDYMQVDDTGGPRGTGGLNYHNLALRVNDPVFRVFAGADLPSASLGANMVDDAVNLLDYFTWQAPGTVHDLLTTNLSFARTPDVAAIYGVPVWDGASNPPAFGSDARPGLFTRALFVAAGADTSPILKGVYLRRYVLCDTLGRPPPAAANAMVDLSPSQTTRQVTEQLTSVSPCNGCHTHWINPLGFATENFDGLGRARTMQTLFNADATLATRLPIDTSVVPYVLMADGTSKAAGAADVMRQIDASEKAGACFTRNYFRYAFGRFEDLEADGCSLEAMRVKLDGGGHLVDMLKTVVETPAFKQRTFQ